MESRFDITVIGAGIVGLATAYELAKTFSDKRIVVLEKEPDVGLHQSGHNSGVLHSGLYYAPGSSKARNCTEGKRLMEEFCASEGIPFEICGKIIVATEPHEVPMLKRLLERGVANGVSCRSIGPAEIRELEPAAAGLEGIHVPKAGIVDYGAVCRRIRDLIVKFGHEVRTSTRLEKSTVIDGLRILETSSDTVKSGFVVNCAGLHSDRVAEILGSRPTIRIVPFRGEYYSLSESAKHLCKNLIYPVPDPNFPFLGVHFTRMISGAVECGPNAVLAYAREGYSHRVLSPRDLLDSVSFKGFRSFAARHWRTGVREFWRSISKNAFTHSLQRLIPELKQEDLNPAPSGVRAQALSADGRLVDDFLFESGDRVLNVLNAPSPAATSAFAIGREVTRKVQETG